MATESQVRQNYAKPSEDGVNKQINMELCAMYTYLSMVRLWGGGGGGGGEGEHLHTLSQLSSLQ